jgi:hypothetical protein
MYGEMIVENHLSTLTANERKNRERERERLTFNLYDYSLSLLPPYRRKFSVE